MSQPRWDAGAIEVPLSSGTMVRGRQWPGGPDTVLLLHEPGTDLDAWDDLPAMLNDDGLAVLTVDLPGHGLSDDPWRPDALPGVIAAIADRTAPQGKGSLSIVAAGLSATVALLAPAALTLAGIVAFSPANPDPDSPASSRPPARPKLVFAGALDHEAMLAARTIAKRVPGWGAVSTFPTTEQGSRLLAGEWGAQAREQTVGFLRDCRRQHSAR